MRYCAQMLNVVFFACQIAARIMVMALRPAAVDADSAAFYEFNPAVGDGARRDPARIDVAE